MSHSYLDSTLSKLLASHTSTLCRLAVLAAWLNREKLKNKQREEKLPVPNDPQEQLCKRPHLMDFQNYILSIIPSVLML